MDLIFAGQNIDVTEALKNVTVEKLERLNKYFHDEIKGTVTYSTESDRHTVEITINLPKTIIRVEEQTYDMYESLDRAVDVLERRIRKHKSKLQTRYRNAEKQSIRFENIAALEKEEEKSDEPKIVKTKRFFLKPMTSEEAVLQMDLLGHNFFVFMDGETGETNVVYKRKDGNYGLIEPEI